MPPADVMQFIEMPVQKIPGSVAQIPKLGSVAPTTFGPGVIQPVQSSPTQQSAVQTQPVQPAQTPIKLTAANAGVVTTLEATGLPPGAQIPQPLGAQTIVVPPPVLTSVARTPEDMELEKQIFGNTSRPPEPVQPPVASMPPAPLQMVQSYAPTATSGYTQQYVQPQPQYQTQPVQTLAPAFDDDDFEPDQDDDGQFIREEEEETVVAPHTNFAPTAALVPTQATPVPAPAAPLREVPPFMATMPNMPAIVMGLFDNDTDESALGDSGKAIQQVERDSVALWQYLGLAVLHDRRNYDPNNPDKIYELLYMMRWDPERMMSIGPHALCAHELRLTAHQVAVQGMENDWTARYNLIGRELDHQAFKKRDLYSGATVKAKEIAMFTSEPAMRTLRLEYLKAWAMSTLLTSMGERFAQLENAIKRPINLVVDEYKRSR